MFRHPGRAALKGAFRAVQSLHLRTGLSFALANRLQLLELTLELSPMLEKEPFAGFGFFVQLTHVRDVAFHEVLLRFELRVPASQSPLSVLERSAQTSGLAFPACQLSF